MTRIEMQCYHKWEKLHLNNLRKSGEIHFGNSVFQNSLL